MQKKIKTGLMKIAKLGAFFVIFAFLAFLGFRAYVAWISPPLQLWHTFIPKEMTIEEMDAADWEEYLEREEKLFADIRTHVTDKLPLEARVQSNRYFEGSRVYPPNLSQNWNRSYMLLPEPLLPEPLLPEPSGSEKKIKGAVVLLHGLTDSPYSLRHIAREYRDRGFIAIGLRIPAHGTVPAALTTVKWEDWMAATRLAVREAKKRIDPAMPLHIVGFSNGGALAMKYALDALEDPALARPDRLVLLSPMIGITRFARFAGLAGLPAFFPAFAKSSWLGIMPEFNPFKYNSFPVNGARQSHRLTRSLQNQISRISPKKVFQELPPILTFQSVIDYTVSTPAIFYALYAQLPENGSELVLFDVNRATVFGPLMRSASNVVLSRLLPPLPLRYDITILSNRTPNDIYTASSSTKAGETIPTIRDLDLTYPSHIFSLSHVSIPFPMDDPLYGMTPPPGSDALYGVNLGTLSARGERGTLIINMDSLFRTSSNPFFPYLLERVTAGIKNPLPERIARSGVNETESALPPAYEAEVKKFLEDIPEEEINSTP